MSGYSYRLNVQQHKPDLCTGCPDFKSKCVTQGTWDPEARLTILGESPSWVSVNANGPFMGRNGMLLHRVVAKTVYEYYDQDFTLKYNTGYAAGSVNKLRPKIAVLDHCKSIWQTQWANQFATSRDPHVILALGFPAAKACGVVGRKISETRGKVFDLEIGNRRVKVIPTFSLNHLQASPGITSIIQSDLRKAIEAAYFERSVRIQPIEELGKEYRLPQTIAEVKDVCDYIIDYYDPAKQSDPWKWPISVDTETNTLKPWKIGAKVLITSFGWDDGQSAAIMLDHPEVPYDPAEAWPHVARVLACPKPKTLHNAKFDLNFLEGVYGFPVNNVDWDTMLGEHWIDEDRKGTYGLKVLAPLYAPQYEGYEENLHTAFRKGETLGADEPEKGDGLNFWEEGVADTTICPNAKWRFLPDFPEGADADLIQAYVEYRDTWFLLDEAGQGRERGKVIRKWKKVSKQLGVPTPTPTPTKKTAAKVDTDRGFEDIPLKELLPYAAADTDVTRIIQKKQYRKIHFLGQAADAHNVMQSLCVPGSRALGRMEYRGTRIDSKKINTYETQLTALIDEQEARIYDLVLRDFNIKSKDELSEVMQSCGFEVIKTTEKTRKMSITKEVLNTYQTTYADSKGPPQDANRRITDAGRLALVEALLLYTDAYNMKSRFIKKLRVLSQLDGRIHTNFKLAGTATGRLSSSDINLQNIPLYMCRQVRKYSNGKKEEIYPGFNVKAVMIPDDDDEVFWNLDIKGAEIRGLCYETGDEDLIQAVRAGADIHTVFLTKVKHPGLVANLNDPAFRERYDHYLALYHGGDKDIGDYRTAIKRTIFGTLYGARAKKIAEQLGDESPEGIAFAQSVIDAIFSAFPTIKKYITRTEEEVEQYGYVGSAFGRYRRFPLARVDRYMLAKAKREAVNFKIQSLSSDLVLSLLCSVEAHAHEIGAKVQLTVHDSIAGSIKKSRVPEMRAFFDKYVINETARRYPWMPVPWLYDLDVGPSYGEKETYDSYVANNFPSALPMAAAQVA